MKVRKMKKLAAAVAVAAAVMAAGTAASAAGTMTIGVTSFADTLEPTEQYFSWVISRYGVGQGLTKFDAEGNMVPCLATEWSNSEDGKTWTFTIREGVKFSNGNDMTPELVKASLERTFEMSNRVPEFFDVASIEVDGQNLIFNLNRANANMAGCLADPLFLIMDTSIDKSFDPAGDTVVVRNEYYWEGEVPNDSVTLRIIGDQTTRSMALQSGEIDVAYNLKTENVFEFDGNDAYTIQSLESLRSTYAFMNQNGALGDLALRQALLRGLDKETYTSVLLEGGATPAKAPVPPTLDYGYDELNDANAYDPEGAKQLLADTGYVDSNGDGYVETPEGEPLELTFVYYDSRAELGVYAQAAQASLKEIGINIKLDCVSYETMLDRRDSGQYDLLIWNVLVANTGDPENYLRENWYSTSANNTAGYANADVDAWLDELAATMDADARRELIVKIQQAIMDDAATVFFGYENTFLISKSSVEGLVMYPMDYYWVTADMKMAE